MNDLADEVDGFMEIASELRLDRCIELFEAAGLLERLLGASKKLAEKLSAPVCCNYQHIDAPSRQASMELKAQADVVLALGARLDLFSSPPVYTIALTVDCSHK